MLVIDDDAEVRALVRMVVDGEAGIELAGEAGDGASGILVAMDCRPDIIILELQMPVMDGLTALPDLRRAAPNAAIVVWTESSVDSRIEQQALKLGADAYVPKSVNEPLAILEVIRASCASRT